MRFRQKLMLARVNANKTRQKYDGYEYTIRFMGVKDLKNKEFQEKKDGD